MNFEYVIKREATANGQEYAKGDIYQPIYQAPDADPTKRGREQMFLKHYTFQRQVEPESVEAEPVAKPTKRKAAKE